MSRANYIFTSKKEGGIQCRVGKDISAQASPGTGRERLHSSGSSYSVFLSESI